MEMARVIMTVMLASVLIRSDVKAYCSEPVLRPITEPVELAEGPFWYAPDKALYFVDIGGKTLHRLETDTKRQYIVHFNMTPTFVLPLKGERNRFVLSQGLEITVLTWDWITGYHSICHVVTVDNMESSGTGLNDGKADARGRVWAGTASKTGIDTGRQDGLGTLYRLDNEPGGVCRVKAAAAPVTISNGMAWSADNKLMYYTDTLTRRVDVFDYNLTTGGISNQRPAFVFGNLAGYPDGMTIDCDGNLWVACWKGSQVIQVDPRTGRLLRQVKLPVSGVTSVAFGGDKMDILYVTTDYFSLTPEERRTQPLAGAVWEVTNLKVTGAAAYYAVVIY